MELRINRIDKGWNVRFLVFSTNVEILTSIEPGENVDLFLSSILPKELEPNRKPEFTMELNQMILKKEGGQIQGSGEIIGPWVFEGCQSLDAFIQTADREALL